MELQGEIMDRWSESFAGKTVEVFVQGEEDGMLWGRTYADSPDIDGRVLFNGWADNGTFVPVLIRGCENGELTGEQADAE